MRSTIGVLALQGDVREHLAALADCGVRPVRAVFIRAPWVESVGPGVQVLATVPDQSEDGPDVGRIVAVRQGSVLATAFHPELTGDGRIHRLFCDLVRQTARAA
jgi:5'-phosphate synthase pdxT subunit